MSYQQQSGNIIQATTLKKIGLRGFYSLNPTYPHLTILQLFFTDLQFLFGDFVKNCPSIYLPALVAFYYIHH